MGLWVCLSFFCRGGWGQTDGTGSAFGVFCLFVLVWFYVEQLGSIQSDELVLNNKQNSYLFQLVSIQANWIV